MKKYHKSGRTNATRFLAAIAGASLFLSGNAAPTYAKPKQDKASRNELRPPLSLTKIHEIESKIPLLKPGSKNVLETLGLTNYSHQVDGRGPTSNYRFTYFLREGYSLALIYDVTKKPAMFKRAEMRKPARHAAVVKRE